MLLRSGKLTGSSWPLRRGFFSRRRALAARLFSFVTILCISTIVLLQQLRGSASLPVDNGDKVVVTLASSSARLASNELAIALYSLLRQTLPAREIRLYLPLHERALFQTAFARLDHPVGRYVRQHSNVIKVEYRDDIGPSGKFVYAIKEQLEAGQGDIPLVVVDDDHAYAPTLLYSLLAQSASLSRGNDRISVGQRGWRIRKNLRWGVPVAELRDHVAEGHTLAAPYRVGVLTANEGYLVYPRWFSRSVNATASVADGGSTPAAPPSCAGLLDVQALSSGEAHLVDDIWMAGHLSRGGVQRWVVPLIPDLHGRGSSWLSPPSIDVTVHHALESHMKKDGHTREDANNYALQLFREAFERENLWYTLRQDRAAARDGYYTQLPVLKPWHSLWLVQVSNWIARVRIWLSFGGAA